MLAEVCAGLLPGVPDEEVGSLLGGFVVGLGADVGVGLHGEADVGMPDPRRCGPMSRLADRSLPPARDA